MNGWRFHVSVPKMLCGLWLPVLNYNSFIIIFFYIYSSSFSNGKIVDDTRGMEGNEHYEQYSLNIVSCCKLRAHLSQKHTHPLVHIQCADTITSRRWTCCWNWCWADFGSVYEWVIRFMLTTRRGKTRLHCTILSLCLAIRYRKKFFRQKKKKKNTIFLDAFSGFVLCWY